MDGMNEEGAGPVQLLSRRNILEGDRSGAQGGVEIRRQLLRHWPLVLNLNFVIYPTRNGTVKV